MSTTIQESGFEALDLPVALCRMLARQGITVPTPIQSAAIPHALEGRDVIGIAQTGTGKTLAFGLPMLCRLEVGEQGLILAPTRELAQQIQEALAELKVPSALIIGGSSMHRQIQDLRRKPHVIVATPGRLIDHMNQRTIRLNSISMVVLDEADRMLDMGFAPAIKRILAETPATRQTMLFSATMPVEIDELAKEYLRNPERIEVARPGEAAHLVEQELIIVPFEQKHEMLEDLLDEHHGSILVFARTRHGARKLAKAINMQGHRATEIHADRTLAQRRAAIQGFKQGEFRVLVATDIAARGIDVKDIELVLNFDLPDSAEDYVHRIGRTGRAGAKGRAVSLALPDQHHAVRAIEKVIGARLPVSPKSTAEHAQRSHSPARRNRPAMRRRPTR